MKTVIITGGNSGLGYYCARTLALDPQWYVIIACRDRLKASQAVKKIQETTHTQQIEAMMLDLASLKSIRSFAAKFSDRQLPPLGAVVCNVGVQFIASSLKDRFTELSALKRRIPQNVNNEELVCQSKIFQNTK